MSIQRIQEPQAPLGILGALGPDTGELPALWWYMWFMWTEKPRVSVGDLLGLQSLWERYCSNLFLFSPYVCGTTDTWASKFTIPLRAGEYPSSPGPTFLWMDETLVNPFFWLWDTKAATWVGSCGEGDLYFKSYKMVQIAFLFPVTDLEKIKLHQQKCKFQWLSHILNPPFSSLCPTKA